MDKLGLSAACGAEPRVHTAGLEVATNRARADFAISILPGQPDFDVMGATGAKPHIPDTKRHGAIGQLQTLQNSLGTFGHAVKLGAGVIGMGDRDHLHLFKLMLAQHPGGVAPRAARFRTKTQGMGRVATWQLGFVQGEAGDDIGQSHLRGWDQPPAIGGLIAILGKFRQLPRAAHGLVAHQDGGVGFGQTIFIHMGVEHELRQCSVHTGDGA